MGENFDKIKYMSITLSPRSLSLYLECPHCFWLDKKMGVKRPQTFPYDLNQTMDALMQEEFDYYRRRGEQHPLLEKNKIKAKLFSNKKLLERWRDSKRGLQFSPRELKATLLGAVDDILEFSDGSLAPLDYKATNKKISKVYDEFQLQMDAYAFLLSKNGYTVRPKAYMAFYIVDADRGFVDSIPFRKELVEIKTDPTEIYEIFTEAVALIKKDKPPRHSRECLFGTWAVEDKDFLEQS